MLIAKIDVSVNGKCVIVIKIILKTILRSAAIYYFEQWLMEMCNICEFWVCQGKRTIVGQQSEIGCIGMLTKHGTWTDAIVHCIE